MLAPVTSQPNGAPRALAITVAGVTAAGTELTLRHPVERFTLDNGLRVVLAPDRSVPVVAVSVFYDVGMRNEPEGRTGFAHLFEHLMFQGSAHVPKMEHARLVQAAGGTFNGSTHQDYTNYFEALPAEALERALFLEADRMAAPAITEENLRNQIDVVKEEIRVNVLNRPYGAFPWLQLPQVAFESFANTHDGYGSFVDLESSTVDDAADFFSTYYAPGNAVLCIGGDLDVAETERLVQRWFGPVPARDVPPTPRTGEPAPTSVRSAVVEDRLATAPAVALGWRVPDPVARFDEYLGTVLLAELLSEGDASRLERRLIHDDRTAIAQSSYVGLFGDPFDVRDATLLTTQVHHPAGVPVERVTAAVHEEIARIATDGVPADELRRVQARTEAQLLRQADSVLGRTLAFASAELVHGRAELAGELAARLAAVPPEAVQAAARGLDPGTVAVLELRPAGGRQ
ncbi:Predicted Zn-dependent peptidase [Blastococcus fimeti]|nr:Predicted Zn-dependent peptidase [Blastococcus fimeti]